MSNLLGSVEKTETMLSWKTVEEKWEVISKYFGEGTYSTSNNDQICVLNDSGSAWLYSTNGNLYWGTYNVATSSWSQTGVISLGSTGTLGIEKYTLGSTVLWRINKDAKIVMANIGGGIPPCFLREYYGTIYAKVNGVETGFSPLSIQTDLRGGFLIPVSMNGILSKTTFRATNIKSVGDVVFATHNGHPCILYGCIIIFG